MKSGDGIKSAGMAASDGLQWLIVIAGYLALHAVFYRLTTNPMLHPFSGSVYVLVFVSGGYLLFGRLIPKLKRAQLYQHRNMPPKLTEKGPRKSFQATVLPGAQSDFRQALLGSALLAGLSIALLLAYMKAIYWYQPFSRLPAIGKSAIEMLSYQRIFEILLLTPFAEEFFYRYCLQSWLVSQRNAIFGLLATSIFFLLPHPVLAWPAMAGLSFLAGLGYMRYGLLSAFAIHAAYNTFILILRT